MAVSEHYFVEWKEQYVSKERGNRVVHYFLKDNLGESICAVVGTERSVRHMFYVVSEEFLNAHGVNISVHSGFRWRSRREVVNWLTSMLSKQRIRRDNSMSPKDDVTVNIKPQQTNTPSPKGRLSRSVKAHHLDISWDGSAWACCKQLKHYPAFQRNGISIAVHSFVFVMAEKDNRYVAYLEDMYEDKKSQKKVKVRWFHHYKEVRGVVALRDPDPKELFITPYAQVISVECVDGPAVVLTHKHYEKCVELFPNNLLGGVYYCCRQFKSNRLKPFRLSKLRGYLDQPIFSCFSPDFFEEEKLCSEDDVKVGTKRKRSDAGHQISFKKNSIFSGELDFHKNTDANHLHISFTPNQKVEFLCQDSGIRGCWFRCTVLEVCKRQIKILYDDLTDEDDGNKPQEWVPMYRVAKSDKLGMRHHSRPTVRPAYPHNQKSSEFNIGDPADAWWCDGWWEGVITSSSCSSDGFYQFYIPGENLYLKVKPKNLRVSREWIGDQWVDVDPKPNILSIISTISTDPKLSASSSAFSNGTAASNTSPTLCPKVYTNDKLSAIEEEIPDLEGMTLVNVPLKDECTNEDQQNLLAAAEEKGFDSDHSTEQDEDNAYLERNGGNDEEGNDIDDEDDLHQENKLVECKIAGPDLDAETTVMLTSECR